MGQMHSPENFLIKIPVTRRSLCQSIHRWPPLARGVFPYCIIFCGGGGSPPWLRSLGRFRDGEANFQFVGRFGYQFASWWDLIVLQPLQVPAIGVEIACAQSGCFSLLVKLS